VPNRQPPDPAGPENPAIVWFRDDLRLADNPALAAAHASGKPLVLLYVLDETSPGVRPLGGAAKWWLDKSLRAFGDAIAKKGGRLILRRGQAEAEIASLLRETGADAVYWNRRYGAARETDARIKKALQGRGVEAHSFNGALLVEPMDLKNGSGEPYKVFTPFWRALQQAIALPPVSPEPRQLGSCGEVKSAAVADWALHPAAPDWSEGLARTWTPGEAGARKRLRDFLKDEINGYAGNRDLPALDCSSHLSPHLHFGEISPAQIWRAAIHAQEEAVACERDIQKFLSELAWRDFSHHLLFHDPKMTHLSWRREFEDVAWRRLPEKEFRAWSRGLTGYPIVDAGMRQLWATGYMHNRVRMIAASFLTKDLLGHWRKGEQWFWNTLVDADEANNAMGWQWVAGSGADAAPYFRVFNPVLQGEKFDPEGAYVRTWAPELAGLPDRYIHKPWEAPALELAAAGVTLGVTYPEPILDHGFARKRALDAYGDIKQSTKVRVRAGEQA
jgi:deoxyribodipyrimidine photo-lyase